MQEIFDMQDANADGKIEKSEFLNLVRRYLEELLDKMRSGEIGNPEEDDFKNMDPKARKVEEAKRKKAQEEAAAEKQKKADEAERRKQIAAFEKYLSETGIAASFQLIFSEIIAKRIPNSNVFQYAAMRLRQVGSEIAHLLPEELTAPNT